MFEYGNRTSTELESRLPELLQSKMNMPPPAPRQPSASARQHPGHPAQAGRRVALAPTTTVPMRIPTISAASMMAQHGGSNMRRARRGIQITISASKRSTTAAAPFPTTALAANNTAAMPPPPRRQQKQQKQQQQQRGGSRNGSPVSIYGNHGGAYHSFTVCTSKDCDLCNHSGDLEDDNNRAGNSASSRRQGSFFLHENNDLPSTGETDLGRSGNGKEDGSIRAHRRRRLIPQTCEHCRMQFIPVKKDQGHDQPASSSPAEEAAAAAGGGDDVASYRCGSIGSSCSGGSSDGDYCRSVVAGSGPVVLEGSLAGGSSLGSAASPLAANHTDSNSNSTSSTSAKKDGPFSPLSQLISNRTASPSPASIDTTTTTTTGGRPNSSNSSSRSSAYTNNSGYGSRSSASRPRFYTGSSGGGDYEDGDGSLPQESGFCSGDCKMSYMLTNPAAVRRRRAAAAARAAMRAAQIENSIERSRRAAAAATAAAAEERRTASAAASRAQRAAAAAAAASSPAVSSASRGEQGCPTTSN